MKTNTKLNEVIEIAKQFTDDEWIEFKHQTAKNSMWIQLDDYKDPITTRENAYELQKKLIQTVINFIKENKLNDIDEIEFKVDCLKPSVEFGSWCPATDSYLGVVGVQKDDKDKYLVRKFITESL